MKTFYREIIRDHTNRAVELVRVEVKYSKIEEIALVLFEGRGLSPFGRKDPLNEHISIHVFEWESLKVELEMGDNLLLQHERDPFEAVQMAVLTMQKIQDTVFEYVRDANEEEEGEFYA